MPNDKPPQTDPGLSLGVEDIQWTLATDTPLITTRHLLLNGVEGMRKGVWWTADASAWVSQAYGFVEEAVHSGDDLDGDYGHTRDSSERSIQNGDSPEATAARGVRLFCESGGPNNSGDEVLHLPTIVEAAESSPSAATQAAIEIRKFLSTKNYQRAYVQYNAIMLVRILSDNPGKTFTRNIDGKFIGIVKDLLREGRDMSVQQILRETLDSLENNKPNEETLAGLREMWKKEKEKMNKRISVVNNAYTSPSATPYQHQQQQQQTYFSQPRHSKGLPPPAELSQRVEEAKTSAKLLGQLVQTTPPSEVLSNDLIKEFAERCATASRSMQKYIHSDNPAPDEDTLLTLIETNDALATSMSRHQRALLQARRVASTSPPQQQSRFSPPPPQQSQTQTQNQGMFSGPPPTQTYNNPSPPQQPQRQQSTTTTTYHNHPTLPPINTGRGSDALASSLPPAGKKENDPFADSHEIKNNNYAHDPSPPSESRISPIPQNYGLPPDNVPVPGSPKGDGAAEWGRLPFREQAAKNRAGTGGGDRGGVDRGGVGGGNDAPVLQHPKPRYRF